MNNKINRLQFVLRVGTAHITKGADRCKHCPNFAFFELFLNRNSSLYIVHYEQIKPEYLVNQIKLANHIK